MNLPIALVLRGQIYAISLCLHSAALLRVIWCSFAYSFHYLSTAVHTNSIIKTSVEDVVTIENKCLYEAQ